MVIGGDVDFGSFGTNKIELLTPNVTLAPECKKNVESLFGEKIDVETVQYDNESQDDVVVNTKIEEFNATYMTGHFVKDVPISNYIIDIVCFLKFSNQFIPSFITVCGKENILGGLYKCKMYDFSDYRWKDIPPMKIPRLGATSSLTPDGDLWILGGATLAENNLKTEVYDFDRNVWRTGIDLPEAFRDTGLTSHCTVRYVIEYQESF